MSSAVMLEIMPPMHPLREETSPSIVLRHKAWWCLSAAKVSIHLEARRVARSMPSSSPCAHALSRSQAATARKCCVVRTALLAFVHAVTALSKGGHEASTLRNVELKNL